MPYFVSLDTILRVDESEATNREQAIQAAIRQLKMHLDNPESGLIWQVEEDIAYDYPIEPSSEVLALIAAEDEALKAEQETPTYICPECGGLNIVVEESEGAIAATGSAKAGKCQACKHIGPLIDFEYDLEPDDWQEHQLTARDLGIDTRPDYSRYD